jgi:hypothetical protein
MSDSDRPVWPDQPSDRDLSVARALHSLPVPDHRLGFWAELDARLAAIDAALAEQEHDTGSSPTVVEDAPSRFDAGQWPLAEPLPIESGRERRARRRRVLLAVAVVLLVTAAGTALYLSRRADRDLQPAGVSDPTPAMTPVPTTVAEPAAPTPKAAVRAFVHTIGGDKEAAFAMLTAESRAFLGSAAQLASGFAREFSAWNSPGAIEQVNVMVARSPAGVRAAVVTYTGTVDIEGTPQPRTQAFAVVRERGAWRISLTATSVSASAGAAIEMISPAVEPELECCGIGGVVAEGEPIRFTVAAVAAQIQFVSVAFDAREPLDPEQLELADMVVTARPRLATGTHVVTIAVVLPDGDLYARAVQFVVG